MRPAYYNENDPFAAQWLRNLITKGLIPAGDVDERSIVDVRPDDIAGYGQCHFFAGIGGFAYACRLAGWPDDRPIWTGGFPCQPFSVAGRQLAEQDDRHLWPVMHRLIAQGRPAVFVGENVTGIIPLALDGVFFDLESSGYASRAFVIPACAVDAPHRRDRVWIAARNVADPACELRHRTGQHDEGRFTEPSDGGGTVAHTDEPCAGEGRQQRSRKFGRASGDPGSCVGRNVANPDRKAGRPAPRSTVSRAGGVPHGVGPIQSGRRNGGTVGHSDSQELSFGARQPGDARAQQSAALRTSGGSPWIDSGWIAGADGKARRVEPGIRLLAHGVSGRVGRLRAYGNAIVPQVAAEVIRALMD